MKKFYVIGNNTSESLSPTIFNYWFKKYKIKAKYSFLELNNKNFDQRIQKLLKTKNVFGLNITIPFKEKIIKHIDVLNKSSKDISAVNCVSISSKIKGINTDWLGYYKTVPNKKMFKNKNIVLIGYGGAAHAIHYVLHLRGFKKINIINRTKKKLKFVKKNKFTISIKKLNKHLINADLIINTTPINLINIKNKNLIKKDAVLSDIVYKPKETTFLKNFPDNEKIYGISMLLEQAILSFNFWFGFKPSLDIKLKSILDKKTK